MNLNLVFSCIFVFQGFIDYIIGYVLKDLLFDSIIKNEGDKKLKDIVCLIIVVSDDQIIQFVFNYFLKIKEQIVLVIGQFGGMMGIIIFEDVIEIFLGFEIVDEFDNIEDMQVLVCQKWE